MTVTMHVHDVKVIWMAKADTPDKNIEVEYKGLLNVLNALTFSRLKPSPRDSAQSELLLDFNVSWQDRHVGLVGRFHNALSLALYT
jgi:hypothetical protein